MTPLSLSAEVDDALLVQRSLAGDRQAFSRIVARYQSIVCALAYSATGSRCHSEDLAQETFVSAWRNLRDLREPARLRAWLCGIARHVIQGDIRRLGRQPAHAADALDSAATLPSLEPLPTAQAVSNEELAILWREVSRLPESYREPLVLYYREHKSVEHVAAALELTPEAVMQRLSRGRRLLQDRMLEFVETTLERTNPGSAFTLQVTAALPVLVLSGPAVAAGAAAPGGAIAKGGVLGFLALWVAPFVGVFAAMGVSWLDLRHATHARERRLMARWTLALWLSAAAFIVALPLVSSLAHAAGLNRRDDWVATAPQVALWFGFTMIALTLVVCMLRGRAALRRQLAQTGETSASPAKPMSPAGKLGVIVGFLTALFWVLIFLAWRTGDRTVALAIVGVVVLLGLAPLVFARHPATPAEEARNGGWYVGLCGLVFLGLLNWRLHAWLAPIYGVDLATAQRLLPPALLHALSLIAVGWTAALLFLTRPDAPESTNAERKI